MAEANSKPVPSNLIQTRKYFLHSTRLPFTPSLSPYGGRGEGEGAIVKGEDAFVEGLIDYLRKHKDVPEIPKSQRYVSRPGLEKLFTKNILQIRKTRDRKIIEAVEE